VGGPSPSSSSIGAINNGVKDQEGIDNADSDGGTRSSSSSSKQRKEESLGGGRIVLDYDAYSAAITVRQD